MCVPYLPGVYADLRYATENNFTGQVIYDFTQPQLRYGTLKSWHRRRKCWLSGTWR